ncbi:hypothetical protein SO802_022769 [Lithocarpus litseifolius]|uniref:Uncharacterized protein n=1 Tax=Lithocarpus litseifolius TaxID=425828 RepID=A0AAW2C4D1_9ROSI
MGKEKQEITWREETNPEEILVLGNWGLSLKVVKQSERNLVRSNLLPSFKVMKQSYQGKISGLLKAHGGCGVGKIKGLLNIPKICLFVLRQRHCFFPANIN